MKTELLSTGEAAKLDIADGDLIRVKRRTPSLVYIFKHALTQEVAYKSLLRQKRALYHAYVAGAIEQLYARRIEDSYEVLAYHYDRSEDAQKAYEYLRLSGEKAIRTYFLWEAYDYFKKALAALDRLPHEDNHRQLQLEVLHLMIIPIIALGLPEDSLAFLERGVRVSKAVGDHGSMTRFYSNIGVFYMSRGNYDEGTTYTRRAFETAERIGDVDAMAQAGPDLCQDFMNAGNFRETIRVATRIIDAVDVRIIGQQRTEVRHIDDGLVERRDTARQCRLQRARDRQPAATFRLRSSPPGWTNPR